MNQVIDTLPIDWTDNPTGDAMLHADAYQLANDERTPHCLEMAKSGQQPDPVPMLAEQHRRIDDRARGATAASAPDRLHNSERASATRRAASSSAMS